MYTFHLPYFGDAFFTRTLWPSMDLPFMVFMAALASPVFGISTKAKPLEPPVSLSFTKTHDWVVKS
jgi:hypothetical protein